MVELLFHPEFAGGDVAVRSLPPKAYASSVILA
jgi:hypothetical protein